MIGISECLYKEILDYVQKLISVQCLCRERESEWVTPREIDFVCLHFTVCISYICCLCWVGGLVVDLKWKYECDAIMLSFLEFIIMLSSWLEPSHWFLNGPPTIIWLRLQENSLLPFDLERERERFRGTTIFTVNMIVTYMITPRKLT